jgi:hypothetical protein
MKTLAQENLFTKVSSLFLSGTIGHKVAVVIGILGVVVGVWYALVPLLISIAGLVIIQIAINDHEKMKSQT